MADRERNTIDLQRVVSRDPEIHSGDLVFAGTRVPVQNLFGYLKGTSSLNDFLDDFPSVSREAAIAVLEAARVQVSSPMLLLLAATSNPFLLPSY